MNNPHPDLIPILFLFVKYSYGICLFRLRTDQEQCIVSSTWFKNGKNRPSKAGTFTLKCAEIETWSQDIWVWTFVFSWLQSLTFLPRFAERHVRLLVNQRQIAACDLQRPAWCVISKVSEQEGPVTNYLNYEHKKLWHLSGYGCERTTRNSLHLESCFLR